MREKLKEVRKAWHERKHYGRPITDEEIEETFQKFNDLPPTRMEFCTNCGREIVWERHSAGFSAKTGKPGHTYHLQCPLANKGHWYAEDTKEVWYQYAPPFRKSTGNSDAWKNKDGTIIDVPIDDIRKLTYHMGWEDYMHSHYDSHEYRFVESDKESFPADDLW